MLTTILIIIGCACFLAAVGALFACLVAWRYGKMFEREIDEIMEETNGKS